MSYRQAIEDGHRPRRPFTAKVTKVADKHVGYLLHVSCDRETGGCGHDLGYIIDWRRVWQLPIGAFSIYLGNDGVWTLALGKQQLLDDWRAEPDQPARRNVAHFNIAEQPYTVPLEPTPVIRCLRCRRVHRIVYTPG